MPDPHFAVQAQQEELDRLRKAEGHLNDRIIYLRAVLLQMRAEAAHQDSLRLGEIEQIRAELTEERRRYAELRDSNRGEGEAMVPHGYGVTTTGDPQIALQLADQVADGEFGGEEPPTQIKIDKPVLPTPETTKVDGHDSFPEPQAGIPIDEEAKELNVVDPIWVEDRPDLADVHPGPERG